MAKFMKYLFPFFLLPLILSSCAVLINKDYTLVRVKSEIPNTTVQILQDTAIYTAPVALGVLRSRSKLELRFRNDTMDTVFQVKSRVDPWVWGNIYNYGFGAIIDLANPRGYTYPAHIHLTPAGLKTYTNRQYRQRSWYIKDKGLCGIYLEWSLMHIQTSHDGAGNVSRGAPLLNFGLGMHYYLSERSSVETGAGFASTNIGENFDYANLYESLYSWYYRISYQHELREFRFGAGLSLLQQIVRNPSKPLEFDPAGSSVRVLNRANPVSLGPCVGVEWQAGEFVTLGANYMTGLYSFNTTPHWAYRDVVLLINAKLRLPLGAARVREPRPRSYKISDLP